MIFGVTGHREAGQKPGELERFAGLCLTRMVKAGCTEIITGMALGWDLAIAQACVDADIPFIAALPFPGQANHWSRKDRALYEQALTHAKRIWFGGRLPLTHSYHTRDRWIVQTGSQLWALDSGRDSGTHKTVLFAHEVGCRVEDLWSRWLAFQEDEQRIKPCITDATAC